MRIELVVCSVYVVIDDVHTLGKQATAKMSVLMSFGF
jgi:hypothetical protein